MTPDARLHRQTANVARTTRAHDRAVRWYVALMLFLALGIQGCAGAEGGDADGSAGPQTGSEMVQTTDGEVDADALSTDADEPEGEGEAPAADEASAESSEAGEDDTDAAPDSGTAATGPMGRMGMQHHGDEDAYHRQMLDDAVEQGLIDEADADLFITVHDAMDPYRPAGGGMGYEMSDEGRRGMQRAVLASAVDDGAVDPAAAERFTEIHDLLIDEGLMR